MALNLYRRHRRECKAGHPEQSFSSEFEERKKGWKRCECPIVVSGTLQKKFKRQTTGQWEWEAARSIAAQYESIRTWNGKPEPPPPLAHPQSKYGKTIAIPEACKIFLDELAESAAPATHKKYRLLLKRFEAFSLQKGYAAIDQWEPLDVRQFRSTWLVSPATAVRRMAELKSFFEYALSNKWVESNIARLVKNPRHRNNANSDQKLPFSDEEIKRMYAACEKYGSDKHKWKGDDLADFISLSIYTGLRISDVALFHIDRLQPNGEIFLRTTKTGTHVCTWVPAWLQERIKERAKKHGPRIFGARKPTTTIDVITETWRRRLNVIFDACGPWKAEPTPHRTRHTFARILFERGVSVEDVATLLGNTAEITRKRYAAWIPERQARLTRILQDAFEEKPKPKLVKIRG